MQGKLTVAFHGEEGIDAGGVTREWYQVRPRLSRSPSLSSPAPSCCTWCCIKLHATELHRAYKGRKDALTQRTLSILTCLLICP